ncbi:GrlR family regulatory protein [Bradyrhizobium sp. NFR13]|uniref:GrlR family regulatory protein n=1 Tax=Bradyrhizobium sp. NFR13 TaxID=1566285 RepID=UPI000B86C18B
MLLNGLYSIEFSAGPDNPTGSGVVVLCDGILLGGDSSLLYKGTYSQRDGKFYATVRTSRHAHHTPSLFGLDEATLSFAGTIIRGDARGFGASSQLDVKLEVHLRFRAHIS